MVRVKAFYRKVKGRKTKVRVKPHSRKKPKTSKKKRSRR